MKEFYKEEPVVFCVAGLFTVLLAVIFMAMAYEAKMEDRCLRSGNLWISTHCILPNSIVELPDD